MSVFYQRFCSFGVFLAFFTAVLWPFAAVQAQCDHTGRILHVDSCGAAILDLKSGLIVTAIPGIFKPQSSSFVRFSTVPADSTAACKGLPYPLVSLTCLSDTIACVHRFRYKADGTNPLKVAFEAELPTGHQSQVVWDFGDGTKGEGRRVSHTFSKEALYSVCLEVYDEMGCEGKWCNAIPAAAAQSTYCDYEIELTAVNTQVIGFLKNKTVNDWPVRTVRWFMQGDSQNLATSALMQYEAGHYGSYQFCVYYQTQNPFTGAICSATACKEVTITEPSCYIPEMENPEGKCDPVEAPVCGCDAITYNNECDAMQFGITGWWAGKCEKMGSGDCRADYEARITEGSPLTGYRAVFFNHSAGSFNYAQLDFGDGTPAWQGFIWDSIVHYYAEGDLYRTNLSVWNNTGCISSFTQLLSTDAENLSKENLPFGTDYVLPGDANSDRKANVGDLLALGVGYNTAGIPRPNANIQWIPQFSPNWTHTLAQKVNYKHLDCDGSGLTDVFDVDAILKNYTPETFKAAVAAPGKMPRIRLHFPKDTIRIEPASGRSIQIDAEVLVGNPSEAVQNLYGLAFSVKYPSYIGPGPQCDYQDNSFWGLTNHILWLPKDNAAQRQLDMGFVRINKNPVSGFGQVATISFRTDIIIIVDVIDKSGQNNTVFRPVIGNIIAVDQYGNPLDYSVPIAVDSVVLVYEKVTSVGGSLADKNIRLTPNPANGPVTLTVTDAEIEQLTVVDALGRMQWRTLRPAAKTVFDTRTWPSGVYTVRIQTNRGVTEKKLLVP
jgi:PKD repeat protein